jgi:hypothetical protein
LPNREKPANLLMQSLLFHVSIHEGCDRQPLEMTRIHFQSGSKTPPGVMYGALKKFLPELA